MASSADQRVVTVKVEYKQTPPQVLVARMNRFIEESQLPGLTVQLRWVRLEEDEPHQSHNTDETQQQPSRAGTFPSHPNGYRKSSNRPVLRGGNSCPHCLCSPCVIALPPDFLRGACGPHPANDEKRYRLYRSFWGLLSTLGVWQDEEYLQRKEHRTARADKRDIIPKCIITEVRRRYPSHDGNYKDYVSTFEAESAVN